MLKYILILLLILIPIFKSLNIIEKFESDEDNEREILFVKPKEKKKIFNDILPYNLGSLSTNFGNLGLTAGYNNDKYNLNLNKTVYKKYNNSHKLELTTDDMDKIVNTLETTNYPFPSLYNVVLTKIYHIPHKTKITKSSIKVYGSKLEIYSKRKKIEIKATLDHRIQMCAVLLGIAGKSNVLIKGCETIKTSFPNFFTLLKKCGGKYEIQKN